MVEETLPISTLPGSSDSPVAFINNADLFTALVAGETFTAPADAVVLTFNVIIDPAVFMTKFQIRTNGEAVVVKVKLEDVDTLVDLTVKLVIYTH